MRSEPGPTPRLKLKGQRTEFHHLFKSDIKPLKKNVSYKKGAPKIELIDHVHIFHNITSQMKPQQYCSTASGHFHEVTWKIGQDGQPVMMDCGPPLHYRYVKKPSGQRRMIGKLEWKDDNNDTTITDDHRHVFQYIHSEEIRESTIRAVVPDRTVEEMAALGLEETGA